MYIVFIGPPGVGKGTQSRRLARHFAIPHLSTGELLRAACAPGANRDPQVSQHLAQGRLVSDQVVNEIVNRRLADDDCSRGCLFDGYPRTKVQARVLDELLAARSQKLDLVLELRADEDELIRRLQQRASTEKRTDDSPETIRHRLRIYREETAPLIEFYQHSGQLQTVEGVGTQDEVFDRIAMCLPAKQRS